ncbi:TnsA endonuclease C-terminal domain-containing protein [Deinococcus planocerae]|uniref:TnsA endonuclease C-terminal domain-containing protein n=1 Tax=Deinococcus planocerae TaxID=1737569 RepID=UPI000C7E9E3F|nr:TnsA endonuclease C-terminal domain-containing protein [Deinococcus planocerae]
MAKRNRGLTKESILKRWKEGRGQGEGAEYQPWLSIQDVPSQGQVNRQRGWKTGRVHHLMSLNELRYFYLLEWAPNVIDIREQFPLWPPEETEAIAKELGFKHPSPPGGGSMVMTSDFYISLQDGEDAVRTVKQGVELSDERTVQKLDIEREYWSRRDVSWGIVVADDIPLPSVENIEWLHSHLILDGFDLNPDDVPTLTQYLTSEVRTSADALSNVARRCDDDLGLEHGSCLALARHLLATRQWETDMSIRINPARPLVLRQAREE